jgi:hypothetical protein
VGTSAVISGSSTFLLQFDLIKCFVSAVWTGAGYPAAYVTGKKKPSVFDSAFFSPNNKEGLHVNPFHHTSNEYVLSSDSPRRLTFLLQSVGYFA